MRASLSMFKENALLFTFTLQVDYTLTFYKFNRVVNNIFVFV